MGATMERWRCGPSGPSWLSRCTLVFWLVALPAGTAQAKSDHGENVHRPDVACVACHTSDRDTLNSDRTAARGRLAPDLEQRCTKCHDEGPSHRTGIPAKKPVPDTLQLSQDGLITCATCHFSHGEPDPFHDFLRMDNSRGGLCLTCHELSELQ